MIMTIEPKNRWIPDPIIIDAETVGKVEEYKYLGFMIGNQ